MKLPASWFGLCLLAGVLVSPHGYAQLQRIEDTDPLLRFSSDTWLNAGESAASGRTIATSYAAGAAVSVTFKGTGISWLGYRCRCAAGIARVYLDGVLVGTVETWKPEHGERLAQAEIFRLGNLSDGKHVFTVEVTGDYNRAGDSAYVAIDAFDISGTALAAVDANPPEVRLTTPAKSAILAGPESWSVLARDDIWLAGVRFMVDGEQVGDEDLVPPYSATWDSAAFAPGPHVLTAVARDWLGNTTTSSAVAVRMADEDILQDDDVAISYTGEWIRFTGADYSGESAMGAWQAGASATVRFKGTGFSWIGVRGPASAGIARLRLDGQPLDTVASYADRREPQARVYRVSNLSDTDHELTIDVTGEYAPAGDSAYVVLDAMRIVRGNASGPVDVVPPVAVVTPPGSATPLSGMQRITVEAHDNSAVAGVRLYANGMPVDDESTASPFNHYWNTSEFANGAYTLMAVARDRAGNIAASHTIDVSVFNARDTGKPKVKLAAPLDQAAVSGNVTLRATAADNVAIARVRFLANGLLIGEATSPPWSIVRDTSRIPSGNSYALTVEAIDTSGNVGVSPASTVTIRHETSAAPP